jgi:signal transduction histidine kinase
MTDETDEIKKALTSVNSRYFLIQWLVLGMILLLLGCGMSYSLARQHSITEAEEEAKLTNLAKVMDDNLGYQLNATNMALMSIRDDLPYWKKVHDGQSLTNHRLRVMSDAMSGVRTINVHNAAGTIVASNRGELIGRDLSGRDYFKTSQQHPDPAKLYVSAPFKSVLGTYSLVLARVLTGPKGEFAGIVAATLDPEYFATLLKSILSEPDMRAFVNHSDGVLFLIVPDRKDIEGMDLAKPGSFYTRHVESGQRATLLKGVAYTTGNERMVAMRTVKNDKFTSDKTLMVAVSRDLNAIFATWRKEVIVQIGLFGLLAMATLSGLPVYQRRQSEFVRSSKLMEEELRQALEITKSANSTMSRLLRIVAHEFRTPLGVLTGCTDIMDRYWERLTPANRCEQTEHIRSAARQLTNLLNSVISFTQMGTNRPVKSPQMLDIVSVCRSIATDTGTGWGAGHIFKVTIAADCGTVLLDETLFRRILENLLTNAFRYTPSGGDVSLHAFREKNRFCLEIVDSGIGIPEEEQKLIFDAFYRGANVEGQRGLGLGLSIVNEALSDMGGAITVKSRVGEGTTMRVEIPLCTQS